MGSGICHTLHSICVLAVLMKIPGFTGARNHSTTAAVLHFDIVKMELRPCEN